MINFSTMMPKLNFLSYVSKIDPAFARALEIGIYMTITYIVLWFLQGSFNLDIQTVWSILIAPSLVLIAKRKRDLEKELVQFKFDLENQASDINNPNDWFKPIIRDYSVTPEMPNLNSIQK